uniref:Putative secreted protein n=1 Tax=Anopheles marajoara TaxID=58244 RepID=A0A2M4CC87_9DIPT
MGSRGPCVMHAAGLPSVASVVAACGGKNVCKLQAPPPTPMRLHWAPHEPHSSSSIKTHHHITSTPTPPLTPPPGMRL